MARHNTVVDISAGIVHTKASLSLAGGFLFGGLIFHDLSALPYALGAVIGVLISPDADVDAGNISDRYIRTKVGAWAEKVWNIVWYMYRRSLKHGGELSHFPLISTLGRLSYLFLMLVVIPTLLIYFLFPISGWDLVGEFGWWMGQGITHYKVIVGLMGADLIHYVLDVSTTEHKK